MEKRTAPVLSLGRMARHLGVTADALRALAEAGHVPCLRVGMRLLFSPSAVETALGRLATNEVPRD
jgi:hypothetical protein